MHRLLFPFALIAALAPLAARAQVDPAPSPAPASAREALLRVAGARARLSIEGGVQIASGMRVRVSGQDPETRVLRFLAEHGAAFGLRASELRIEKVLAHGGFTVVRLRRWTTSVPVLLRSVVVRVTPDGAIDLAVAARMDERVDESPGAASEAMITRDAGARIGSFSMPRVTEARRVGLPLAGRIVFGWAVDVEGAHRHERARLVYDRDGELLVAVKASAHALGRVYDPNPVVSMEATSDVELANLTSRERLTGRYIRVSSCGVEGSTCAPQQTAIADDAGDFLFDPVEPAFDDPFAEVSAYFHADRAAAYFREHHGFEWTCCGGTSVMEVVVNYSEDPGTPYDNAAYSPSQCSRSQCGTIVLGQGTTRDFAYDGDVVYHELTHAVVDETAGLGGWDLDGLGISYEPLGINEGTADYFAATIAGDPDIAEYFAGIGSITTSGSLRELDAGIRCPDDLFGEGHLDGRVWAGTLWIIRETIGAEKADALAFLTLGSMADNTVFAVAAELLVASAEALEVGGTFEAADVDAVREAVSALGLAGCRRIVPLDDLEEHGGYSGLELATGSLGGSVVPLHYSLEVPADATAVRLRFRNLTPAGRYTYYFRNDEPLRFVTSRRPPLIHDATTPAAEVVTIGEDVDHALPRCGTLYVALIVEDLAEAGESAYGLRAEIDRSGDPEAACAPGDVDAGAPGEPDAGAPSGDAGSPASHGSVGGGGGCGCDATHHGADGLAWAFLGALWVWRRSRAGLR